jgi:uncharacterized membrane protein YphA (DoxX/SURF4 family)
LVGTGRFEKIGFPDPAFWAYFAGTFEIICGSLVLLGLFTQIASIRLFIIMMTAFVTTKWPILINSGFWSMAHEYRTDFAMTLLLIYLFIYGAGKWSLKEHELFGEDGFDSMVEKVALIEKQLDIYDLSQFTPNIAQINSL